MNIRVCLLCTAALIAAEPAFAQQSPTPAPAPDKSGQLEEVIVTAEHHASNVQKTAISIATVNSDDLLKAGVNRAQDLSLLVPGLDIENGGPGSAAIYIRGVGANPFSALQDQANAFSVDGVFFNRGIGPDVTLYDIDRIEVLKGPQGTLYGRNATGGAVNVITNRPELGDFGGDIQAEVGNYDEYHITGAVNLPVDDQIAVRIAGNRIAHDGYDHDGSDDEDNWALRGGVLYQPSDAVSLFISADYAEEHGRGPGTAYRVPDPSNTHGGSWGVDPRSGVCSPQAQAFVVSRSAANPTLGLPPFGTGAEPYAGPPCDGFTDNKVWGASATLDVDLGFATWTNIGAYRDTDQNTLWYLGPTSVSNQGAAHQWTEESRLASKGDGPLQWIVGGFYFNEQQNNDSYAEFNRTVPYALVGGYIHSNLPYINDTSWALFGQSTYSITDAFRLTAGIRYTTDDKTVKNGTQGFAQADYGPDNAPLLLQLTPFPITVPAPDNNIRGVVDENRVNYRAGVEYDVAPANMIYANVSTGFHAGGLIFGDDVGPLPTSYKPEDLTAYAVGSKNRFFDDRLQLNAEAFYYDYKNLQLQVLSDVNCSSCQFTNFETQSLVITNAGKARIYGLDLDGRALLTPDDQLTFSLLADSSRYLNFSVIQNGAPVSGTGNSLQGLPPISGTVGYQHTFQLGNGGDIVIGAQTRYWGGAWLLFTHNPGSYQGAYTSTNANLTYYAPDDRWTVEASIRNIENTVAMNNNGEQYNAYNPAGGVNAYLATLNPPRTYSLTVGFKF